MPCAGFWQQKPDVPGLNMLCNQTFLGSCTRAPANALQGSAKHILLLLLLLLLLWQYLSLFWQTRPAGLPQPASAHGDLEHLQGAPCIWFPVQLHCMTSMASSFCSRPGCSEGDEPIRDL